MSTRTSSCDLPKKHYIDCMMIVCLHIIAKPGSFVNMISPKSSRVVFNEWIQINIHSLVRWSSVSIWLPERSDLIINLHKKRNLCILIDCSRIIEYYNINWIQTKWRWQGGVYTFLKQREEMAGENLRDGSMEVAFELWTEQTKS